MAREVHKWIPEEPARTVNGSWSGRFDFEGTLLQVLVSPELAGTTYDVGIVDETGMVPFRKLNVQDYLVSEGLDTVIFTGEKKFVIDNANKDQTFRVKLIYQL